MFFLISACLELLSPAIPVIPIFILLGVIFHWNCRKTVLCMLFACYLAAVWGLVGMPNVTYIRLDIHMNLIPFCGFLSGLRGNLLNIALFMPLGFLLPLLWKHYRSGKHTVLMGLGISLTIELLQIFTYRVTDINDLMTNTLGTWIGWLCAAALRKKIPSAGNMAEGSAWEAYIVMAVTSAVMFFVQPFVLSILHDLLLR